MLAIGRALMGRPRLLLLDEPSMGLAPLLINAVFDIIHAIIPKDHHPAGGTECEKSVENLAFGLGSGKRTAGPPRESIRFADSPFGRPSLFEALIEPTGPFLEFASAEFLDQVVVVEFPMEGLAADPQHLGASALVSLEMDQSLSDDFAFGLVHGDTDFQLDHLSVVGRTDRWRKIVQGHDRTLAQHDGALDTVPELSNIARPGIIGQGDSSLWYQFLRWFFRFPPPARLKRSLSATGCRRSSP